MFPDHFSDLLGKIFYGAAFADKVIRAEEVNALQELIAADWKEERILQSFFECINLNYDRSKVIDDVVYHRVQYPELFDTDTNRLIVETAYKIVNASSGTNKSEIVFISQLTNALKTK